MTLVGVNISTHGTCVCVCDLKKINDALDKYKLLSTAIDNTNIENIKHINICVIHLFELSET